MSVCVGDLHFSKAIEKPFPLMDWGGLQERWQEISRNVAEILQELRGNLARILWLLQFQI